MRRAIIAVCGWLVWACAGSAWAAEAGDLLIPQTTAEHHGLTRAWFTQVGSSGIHSHVTAVVLDEDMLLVQASDAMTYALDAETGRLVWSSEVGSPSLMSLAPGGNGRKPKEAPPKADAAKTAAGPAAKNATPAASAEPAGPPVNRQVIAIVNGTTLYLLDRGDGRAHIDVKSKKDWKVSLKNAMPMAGPLVMDEKVFIPTTGQVEVYSIDTLTDSLGLFESSGSVVATPTASGSRVMWGTDQGVLQMSNLEATGVKDRIPLGGPIVSQLAARTPRVFATSLDTMLYCVHDTSGATLWQYSGGSPIRHRPVLFEDSVYALPEDGGISSLSVLEGRLKWANPDAHYFLAASPTRVYVIDRFNRLQVIDAKNGSSLDSFPLPLGVIPVVNTANDRIYLSSREGLIQEMHEFELRKPAGHPDVNMQAPVEEAPVPKGKAPDATAPDAKAADAAAPDAMAPDTIAPEAKAPAAKVPAAKAPKAKAPAAEPAAK